MMRPIALVAATLFCAAALPGTDAPVWHVDWRTARRIARKENKPILAVLVCKH